MISNVQIERRVRDLGIPHYVGTFSKDQLPKHRAAGFYIINMEDSFDHKTGKELPGSHWVALEVKKGSSVYADPYGLLPPTEVIAFGGPRMVYNTKQVEGLNSSLCGYFCLWFLYHVGKGRTWQWCMDQLQTYPHAGENYKVIDPLFGIHSH